VIFRNNAVPSLPVSAFEEPTRQGLWQRLKTMCTDAGTGCQVLAIPHNSNLSEGMAFDAEYGGATTISGQRAIATLGASTEPLVEIYQHKGSSECSTDFSSGLLGADEQCGFEQLSATPCTTYDEQGECTSPRDFVREALTLGMRERQRLGVNPLRLGIIASTDTHNGTPGNVDEASWRGHVGTQDSRLGLALTGTLEEYSPGGLAGVWAIENSRDALFEAMQRRETFGTSGPRMTVRFFGGWSYPTTMCGSTNLVSSGYSGGVPMGGTLPARTGSGAPRFVIQATMDETRLQVAQVVKRWIDRLGNTRERVFDVAGNRANGATVNPLTCEVSGPGSTTLCGVWTDPTFDAAVPAVYYVRVLENPTCRWTAEWCRSLPLSERPLRCSDPNMPRTIQERAWSSPIWYEP
jgi:hypothetical protein